MCLNDKTKMFVSHFNTVKLYFQQLSRTAAVMGLSMTHLFLFQHFKFNATFIFCLFSVKSPWLGLGNDSHSQKRHLKPINK